MHKIISKYNPLNLLFKYSRFDAITLPFLKVVYYKDLESMNNRRMYKHESKHLEQINREGSLRFTIKYLYYSYKYGYWNNPYEIEAREAELR